jgi:hypothetical protein
MVQGHGTCFGIQMACRFSFEGTTYEVLAREMVSLNDWNVLKTITAVFKATEIVSGDSCEGPLLFEIGCSY